MAATKIPDALSDDLNYEIWAPIMKTTLTEKGLWDVVENGVPPDPSKVPELAATIQPEELSKWRDVAVKDMKALQILQSSLTDSAFRKTLSASSAKDVWDSLKRGNEEAIVVRLEKQFEAVRMRKRETLKSYLDRVMDIVEQSRDLKNEKADYEVITKVLGSLSTSFDSVAPLMKKYINLKKMSLNDFLEFLYPFRSLPGEDVGQMLKDSFESQSKQTRGGKNEQGQVEYEHVISSLMLADIKVEEDMWMIHTNTSNHMTPNLKFFTTLDTTYRARVKSAYVGSYTMAQGRGDVKIMTKEGVMTIKNVLYVPKIHINALSVPQLTSIGYSVIMKGDGKVFKCTIKDLNRKLLGETTDQDKVFCLRFQVIEGNLTA